MKATVATEANVAYFLDDGLIRIFQFMVSKLWVQKCCSDGYVFSISKNDCVRKEEKNELSMAEVILKALADGIRYVLLHPARFRFDNLTAQAHSLRFWSNGSWSFENGTSVVSFQRGQYYFDYVTEQNQFMLLNGTRVKVEVTSGILAWEVVKCTAFCLSFLLALITVALYLYLPALRRRVYDKCLICYLINVTVTVVTVHVLGFADNMPRKIFWRAFQNFLLLSVIFWLNVICVHLWRSVGSVNKGKRSKFLYYAVYAWGCSLIFSGLDIIRNSYHFPKWDAIANSWYDHKKIISILVLFVNLCLFLHIAFNIWQEEKKWEGNSESRRHVKKQRRRMWQILKLFLIMGLLEWGNFFNCAYKLGISNHVYECISKFFRMCPGYIIFFVFVWYNKTAVSELKKKFTRRRQPTSPEMKMSTIKIVKHPTAECQMRKVNSEARLLHCDWEFHIPASSSDTFSRFFMQETAAEGRTKL